jgi:5'-nucleotidase
MLCRALREWCNSDCAMVNAGLLLGPLTGEVTVYDLLKVCPHPINPCVVELTGKELEKVLWETKDEGLAHKQIKGLGFRGTLLGVFVYDQISFQGDTILINGTALDYERNYSLALPDMFTFGHFFKNVLPHKDKQYFLPEFLRDILKWKLQRKS